MDLRSRTTWAGIITAVVVVSTPINGLLGIGNALGGPSSAKSDQPAYEINGKKVTLEKVYQEDPSALYELDKKKFDLVDQRAKEAYFEFFWTQQASKSKKTVEEAIKDYEDANIKVSDKDVADTLEQFKDHPQVAKLSKEEQQQQVREYLKDRARRELNDSILAAALKKGELKVLYPEPKEPIFEVTVKDSDHTRFSPTSSKPVKCKGNDCAITVVEYSEFQCPFCSRVLPDVKRVLADYKGKIRWIVRDFPLSFHDRARPAAIAAHCAGEQGKYWEMYTELFENQTALADEDLEKYAKNIKLDQKKYDKCIANPKSVERTIDENFESGVKLGVTGTPAFFINGRRLSGALPYSEFKRVIEEELNQAQKGPVKQTKAG